MRSPFFPSTIGVLQRESPLLGDGGTGVSFMLFNTTRASVGGSGLVKSWVNSDKGQYDIWLNELVPEVDWI